MHVRELHDNGGFNHDAQIIVVIYELKLNNMYNIQCAHIK